MANLTQVAADVAIGSVSTVTGNFIAGEALIEGNPAYKKASDGKWYGTDANGSESSGFGPTKPVIALTPAAIDKPFIAAKSGLVDIGATLAVGFRYAVSATAKAICLESDLVAGDYGTSLGIATTTRLLNLDPQPSGILRV